MHLIGSVCCLEVLCTSTQKAGSLFCQKEGICSVPDSLLKAFLFISDRMCISFYLMLSALSLQELLFLNDLLFILSFLLRLYTSR